MSNLNSLEKLKNYAKMRSFSETDPTATKWDFIEKLTDQQLSKVVKSAKTIRGQNLRMSKIATKLQNQEMFQEKYRQKTAEIVDSAV
jgi:hypothetical protein